MSTRTIIAGRVRRLRPPRRLVMLLLSLLVLVGPLYPVSSQSARAQTTLPDDICTTMPDGKGGFAAAGNPGWVVQGCDLRSAGMAELEQQAVDDLLKIHQLPETDAAKIIAWERATVRAMLFAKLIDMIEKDPAERTASEQAIVDKMTEIVQGRRVAAVQYSIAKYNEWLADACAFEEPVETDYMRDDVYCSGNPNGTIWSGGPISPSIENLLVYGQHHIYEDFEDGGPAYGPSSALATSLGLLAGAVAAGIAGLVGTVIGGSLTINSALIAALHPFLIQAVLASSNPAAITAVGSVGAGTVGSALAIVVIAVVLVIVRIIQVVAQEQIPIQLNEALTNAQAGIDLRQLVETKEGKTEIFAAFLVETLPDYDSSLTAPDPKQTDASFVLTDAGGTTTVSRTLNYQCWNPLDCGSELNHTARLSGGWFVSQDSGTGIEHMTFGIDYIDWNGDGWTAWRVGPREFLHTRTKDEASVSEPADPFTSNEIKFKTWDGSLVTASINQPPATPGTPLTSASGAINNGDFWLFWASSIDEDGDPVTYTLQRCDPDAAVPVLNGGTTNPSCTTIASDLTLETSLTPELFLQSEPHGEWTYRIQASDGYGSSVFTAESAEVLVDRNAPGITVTGRTPEPNIHGWNNSDVTVDWSCNDFIPDIFGTYAGVVSASAGKTVSAEGENQHVTGTCRDNAGNASTNTITGINIDKTAPTADHGGPYTVNEGTPVQLNGGGSSDALSGIAVLQWDLDGNGQNLIANPATFTGVDGPDSSIVYLLVIDKAGNTSAASTTVTIANVAPTATFDAPDSVDEGSALSLALTNPSDPSIADTQAGFRYAFDCGDGDGYGTFGASASAICRAGDDGTLAVKGKIQDKDGGETEYNATVTVSNASPQVDLGDDVEINQGETFSLNGEFSDPGDDRHTATVDYGDGNGEQPLAPNPDGTFSLSHEYAAYGEYQVTVCVTDDDGGRGCDNLQVSVINQPPTVGAGGPYDGDEGTPLSLDATVNDPEGGDLTTSWSFIIDDADPGTTCAFGDPSQVETTFSCTDDGKFILTLIADDGINPPVTATASVMIGNADPAISNAAATISRGQVTISVAATDPSENDVLSYAFDCNNDSTYEVDAGATPTTTCPLNPEREGVFTFGAQVSDDDGGIATDAVTVTIVTELCASTHTGALRYADSCRSYETAVTIPDPDGPVTVCASTANGLLRVPLASSCGDQQVSYALPDDGPLTVCISTYTQVMRVVGDIAKCTIHEFGRMIAATEIGGLPPPSR